MRRSLFSLLVLLWAAGGSVAIGQAVYSVPGTQTLELRCGVDFGPQMVGQSYVSTAGQQLTIFKPGAAGAVAALSLEWLELAPEAQFQVYLGVWDGVSSAQPVYDVAKGPREWVYIVGQQDKDHGALTVVFDPKGVQHGPAKGRAGWCARVDRVSADPATVGAPSPSIWMPQPFLGGALRAQKAGQELLRFSSLLAGIGEGVVEELSFQLSSDACGVQKVWLYELPTPAATDRAEWRLLAEAAPAGRKIVLASTTKLKAGWHHFAVVADMGKIPLDISQLGVSPLAFTIHDDKTSASHSMPVYKLSGEVSIPIDHAIVLETGSAEEEVGEAQDFRPARNEKGAYVSGNDDRSILFVPRRGEVVQLDFLGFDLANNAELRIYRGDKPLPEKVLFEAVITWGLSAEDVLKQLKGHPLRGLLTESEGKLLVVFNPKGSLSSGYMGSRAGWEAQVSSVKPEAWQVTKVLTSSVEQGTTSLYSGAEKQVTHTVVFSTKGLEQQKALTALRLKLTNAGSIKSLSVYSAAKKNYGGQWQLEEANKLGSVAAPGEVAEVTFSKEMPVSGDATLYVAVDVAETAKVVSGPWHVAVQEYQLAGSAKWISAQDGALSAAPAWIVTPIYLMENGKHEFTVDGQLLLYDDGGPEGNPTAGFEGACVLTPKHSGKRIQVVISEMQLVNAAVDPTDNDQLRCYNGPEALPEHELWRYQKGMYRPVTLVSNSPDGSLALYFKSPKATAKGFKCAVYEVEPEPMDIVSVQEKPAPSPSPRATLPGALALLGVEAKGAEAPLTLTKLSLTIPECVKSISAVQAYLYDAMAEKKLALLGTQAAITSDRVELDLTPAKPLRVGENLVLVEVTGLPALQDGTLLEAKDISFSCSNGKSYPEGGLAMAQARKVVNLYQLENDQPLNLTIGAAWELTHKPNSKYSARYDLDTKGGTVILAPHTSGNAVELEFFGDFDFNEVSGSTFSEFMVYSGDKAEGTPLLEVKSKVNSLPTQTKYRPKDGDKALTVVFRANGNKGKGFHAHVCEVKLAPMELKEIAVSQATTAPIAQVGKVERLLQVKLTTEFDQPPLALSELKLKLTEHIQKVHLYATESAEFSTAKPLHEAAVTPGEVVLKLPKPYELKAGDNYLWVAVTLAADAANGTVVDGSVMAIKVGDQVRQLGREGDPVGQRVVQLAYLFRGDDQVDATTPFLFYDDGGAEGNATTEHRGAVTFTPGAGQLLKLVIHKAKLPLHGSKSRFFVYEGTGTSGKKLFEYRVEVKEDVAIMSTAPGTPISVMYDAPTSSSTGIKYFGWEIEVIPLTPTAAAVESVACQLAYPAPRAIRVGEEGVKAFRLAVRADGTSGDISLAELKLALGPDTKAADITRIQCWTTGCNQLFTFPVLLGEVKPAEGMTATCKPSALALSVTSYIWVTYDVASTALPGAKLTLRCEGMKASDGKEYPLTADNESTLGVSGEGMKGVYTIGGDTPNYATLEAAVADLARKGLAGAVTLNMRPGSYGERVVIPVIAGSSAINTITLQAESGKPEDVVIHSEDPYKSKPLEGYGGVLTLRGVSHFTLKNLTVTSSNSMMYAGVSVCEGSHHITISGCKLEMPSIYKTSTKETPHVLYLCSLPDSQLPTDYITLEGCEVLGGAFGLYSGASTYEKNRPSLGLRARKNHFLNQANKAIFLGDGHDLEVVDNRIEVTKIEPMFDFKAIDIVRIAGPGLIARNTISLQNSSYNGKFNFFGIATRERMSCVQGSSSERILIANNVVYMDRYNSKGGSYALTLGVQKEEWAKDQAYVTMAHNTVVLGPAIQGNARGVQLYPYGTAIELSNNLVQKLGAGSVLWSKSDALEGITLRGNFFWTTTDQTNVAVVNKKTKGLAELQQLSAFSETVFRQANFLDASRDWHLLVNLQASAQVQGVEKDLEGAPRANEPTVGAFEYKKVDFVISSGFPALRRVGEDFVEAELAASLPYMLHVLPLPANETPDAEALRKAPTLSVYDSKPFPFRLDALTPGTSYKLHLLLVAPTGEELQATLDFQTLAAGTPLLLMMNGYPRIEALYSDAAQILLDASENCQMSYKILKKGVPLDGGAGDPAVIELLKLTATPLLLPGLESGTDYVLHFSLHAEGEKPSLWEALSLTTPADLPYEPMRYKPAVWTTPEEFFLGSQAIESSELKASASPVFDLVAGVGSKGWHMEGNRATVREQGPRYEYTIPGLALASNGEVKLTLMRREASQSETLTLPSTEGKPAWFSLKDKKLIALRLDKEAGVEVTLLEVGTPKPEPRVQVPAFVTIPQDETKPLKVEAQYIYGGAYPLQLAWYFDDSKQGDGYTLESSALRKVGVLECRIADAEGQTSSIRIPLVLEASTLQVASFEDVGKQLRAEEYWKGSFSGGVEHYTSGSFSFSTYSEPLYHSWHGFAYSNQTSTAWAADHATQDTRSAAGHGACGTPTYGVLYHSTYGGAQPEQRSVVEVTSTLSGIELPGLYLTNTAWGINTVKKGPGMGKNQPFGEGDYFKVTITADNGKQLEKYLVDYRPSDPAQRYALEEWAWVDLSSLGKIKCLAFMVEGYQTNGDGQFFPNYLAVDEIGATRPQAESTLNVVAPDVSCNLLSYTALAQDKASVTAATAEGGTVNSSVGGVSLSLEGTELHVKGWNPDAPAAEETLTFKLEQLGRVEWVKLTLRYGKSVTCKLAEVTFDSKQGEVKVTRAGQEVLAGAELKTGDELTVVATPKSGYTVDKVEVTNATRRGTTDVWVVDGSGDVSVKASFSVASTPEYAVIELSAMPAAATITLRRADGSPIGVGDHAKQGDVVTLEIAPAMDYILLEDKTELGGLEKNADGTYTVVDNITVRVKLRGPLTYSLAQVSFEPVDAGKVVVLLGGKQLAVGDRLCAGDKLAISATFGGKPLPKDSLTVVGAVLERDGLWFVRGNVEVKAFYRQKPGKQETPIEATLLAGLALYPNPATDRLWLSNATVPLDYVVYTAAGQSVASGRLALGTPWVDVSTLRTGVYLLQVRSSDGAQRALIFVKQ